MRTWSGSMREAATCRWNTEVADHRGGYSKTAAPLIVKDKVVTGIAGGEFGIRGVPRCV